MYIPKYTIDIKRSDRDVFLTFIGDQILKALDDDKFESSALRRFGVKRIHDHDHRKCKLFPSIGQYEWIHEGEKYLVTYQEEGSPVETSHGPEYYQRLTVQHEDIRKLRAFVSHALTHNEPVDALKVRVYFCKSKGYWEQFGSGYAQPLAKIFIDAALKRGVLEHVDRFIADEVKYAKYGRLYKLNLLFTGVPGSGKTSLAKAIAMHYHRPVYVLSLSKTFTDDTLVELVSEMQEKAVLLIEDIDAFFHERKPVDVNISFSCLINMLDGTLSKGGGVITVLTANNPERLDPALLRQSRIDRVVHFDYPKKAEIQMAFEDLVSPEAQLAQGGGGGFDAFYGRIKGHKISMSAIVDFLFRHPADAVEKVEELIENSRLLQQMTGNEQAGKLYM